MHQHTELMTYTETQLKNLSKKEKRKKVKKKTSLLLQFLLNKTFLC